MNVQYETLQVEDEEGVVVLRFNRPDRMNAFNTLMREELLDALHQARAMSGLRGLILTGEGRGFCAGQDLGERKPLPPGQTRDLGEGLEKYFRPFILGLRELPVPVVALVNGVAAGAGVSLALACDVVIAVESAKFVQSFTRIGLTADAGASHFMPRLIGSARAMGMALFAEPVTARQALEWGMIWQVVADDQREATLAAVRQRLAGGASCAMAATKRALNASAGNSLEAQFDFETSLQRELGHTEDYAEGVRAFTEKRPPRFQGR